MDTTTKAVPFRWERQTRLEEPLILFEECVTTRPLGRYPAGRHFDMIVLDTEQWTLEPFQGDVALEQLQLRLDVTAQPRSNVVVMEQRYTAPLEAAS